MPKVTFHHESGNATVMDVDPGTSLMRAAVRDGVRGIVGECGGQAMGAGVPPSTGDWIWTKTVPND